MWYNLSTNRFASRGASTPRGFSILGYANMNTLPLTAGIYKITCLADDKIYIGSAVNLRKRWINHKSSLNTGNHRNNYLQKAWNKYGELCFTIEILELCERSVAIEREQYYLDLLQPYKERGFNLATHAGLSTLGRVHSPETRAKLGGNKGRKFSAETKARVSAAGLGRITSEETRAKISMSNSRNTYIVTSPNGTGTVVVGLNKFCKEHGLDPSCMVRVAKGKQPLHKGWGRSR